MRPKSHQIADIALSQFSDVLTSKGWALQRIDKNADYGEDLVAQILYKDELIPYRFYFQIKGTESMNSHNAGTHWRVSNLKRQTVERWLETTDTTVVVLWDVIKSEGYFGFAKELFDWDSLKSNIKYISAKLDKKEKIGAETVDAFGFKLLSNVLTSKVDTNVNELFTLWRNETDEKSMAIRDSKVRGAITRSLVTFLSFLNVLEPDLKDGEKIYRLTPEFVDKTLSEVTPPLAKALQKCEVSELEKTFEEQLKLQMMFTLAVWCNSKVGDTMSPTLMVTASDLVIVFFEKFFREKFQLPPKLGSTPPDSR